MSRCQNYADVLSHYIKAGCDETDAQELRQLATSTVPRIRMRVAENHCSPPDLLESLAQDEEAEVRIAVASNPMTPPETLKRLACDFDPSVRWAIAEDPRTPINLLHELEEDSNAYVRVRAEKTLTALHARPGARSERTNKFVRMFQQVIARANKLQYA